ncbi:hypothetical protein EON65_17600 [archaeon]|nr:MAG: hypothetical protein EON65_17600 [archaeon]
MYFYVDLIPLDQTLDLQNKLSLYPDIDIMASRDVSTLINTGCLLVRNTAWSLGFLKTWHACRLETGAHNEQLGFHCAYNQYTEEESHRKIAILTDHELNSIAPAMHTLLPSHPILHLAAEDNAYRHRVFKLAAQNMLDALKQGSSIPIQLGISRVVLQETAILEYEGIYKEAYATIQTHLQLPVISNIDMDVLERYRMAVSKYCFATEYYQSDLAIPLDHVHLVSVRSEAYETLRSLMCLYIMIVLSDTNRQAVYGMPSQEIVSMVMGILIASTDTGHTSHIHPLAAQLIMTSNQFDELSRVIFQSLPEIAKLTVELAYDLLRSYVDIVPNSSDDVSELVREIHSVLVLLRHTVHPKQVSMVDKMLIEFETFVRHTGDLSD